MAVPFLYSANDATNDYTKDGYGALSGCTTLTCVGEINGEVTLTGSVPLSRPNTDYVVNNNIIKVKINDTQDPQILRLYNVKKSMKDGLVTFNAEPIANDIRGGFLPKVKTDGGTAANAMAQLASEAIPPIPDRFSFASDKENLATVELERVSVLQALGGVEGSVLQKFKGEYEKDNHTIKLLKRLGNDHKIKIIYTKNLTGLDIEVDTQGIVNGIYPYAKIEGSEDDELLEVDGKVVFFEKRYDAGIITAVDFSNDKPETQADLLKLANDYLSSNGSINEPTVSAKVDFILLNKQPRYKDFVNMETVGLGDGVDVYHPKLATDMHARVVKYEYNCLTEQYNKLEIGSVKSNFLDQIANQISEQGKETDDKLGLLEKAQNEVSDLIKNPAEGHVVVYPSLSDPQEILIMDTTDVNTATKLWRWNSSGLGYSKSGYNGTYETAMTKDGQIVADMITTGVLRAIDIIGVTITGAMIISQRANSDYKIVLNGGNLNFNRGDSNIGGIYPTFSTATGNANGFSIIKSDGEIFSINVEGTNGSVAVFQVPADSNPSNVKYTLSGAGTVTGKLTLNVRGVFKSGFRISDDDTAGVFRGSDRNSVWMQGNNVNIKGNSGGQLDLGSGNINVYGNFNAFNGSKNAVHVTRDGMRATPAYEMAESYLGDIGRNFTDENCQVWIPIDEIFSDTVNTDLSYEVFLQVYDNARVWVSDFKSDAFLVCSDKPLVRFAWEIKAKRRGYESERLVKQDVDNSKVAEIFEPEKFKEKEADDIGGNAEI